MAEWSKSGTTLDARAIRVVGEVQTELEMQWIRMFWVQGERHARSHKGFWLPAMKDLLARWRGFEALAANWTQKLEAGDPASTSLRSLEMAIYVLETRMELRREWMERVANAAYARLPADLRPVDCDALLFGDRPKCEGLGADLSATVASLRRCRELAKVAQD
jgi:alpha-ketoglutarate-dependent dioxygenase FTO